MRWVKKSFIVLVLAVILVLSGCSVCESPSAELIGEWEAEGLIVDACTGEIDGKPYLFLLTRQGSSEVTIHVLDVADPVEPIEVAALEAPMGTWEGLYCPGWNSTLALVSQRPLSGWWMFLTRHRHARLR